jgi:hypothetical protein
MSIIAGIFEDGNLRLLFYASDPAANRTRRAPKTAGGQMTADSSQSKV